MKTKIYTLLISLIFIAGLYGLVSSEFFTAVAKQLPPVKGKLVNDGAHPFVMQEATYHLLKNLLTESTEK